jgi:hypothetical protein
MKILIINFGWIGDSMLASSLAENCKLNGYERVDLLVGFPQTANMIELNPLIDNVFISKTPGCDPSTEGIDLSTYDRVYKTRGLVFNKRPLDLFNEDFGFEKLKHPFELATYELEFEDKSKPYIAFQLDWDTRSNSHNGPRNTMKIVEALSYKYNIFPIGGSSQFDIDDNTGNTFLTNASALKNCKLFFGYPGGLHWLAAGVGIDTICTSEHVIKHYTNNGEFKGSTFEEFQDQWQVHASKLFTKQHTLLKPYISDEEIIEYILNV